MMEIPTPKEAWDHKFELNIRKLGQLSNELKEVIVESLNTSCTCRIDVDEKYDPVINAVCDELKRKGWILRWEGMYCAHMGKGREGETLIIEPPGDPNLNPVHWTHVSVKENSK